MGSNRHLFWIRLLGTLNCLLLAVGYAIEYSSSPRPRSSTVIAIGVVLHLVFVCLFRLATRDFPVQKNWHRKVLAAQLVLSALLNTDLAIISALTIPLVLPRQRWLGWMGALVAAALVATAVPLYEVRVELAQAFREQPVQMYVIGLGVGQVLMWIFVAFFAAMLISQIEDDRLRLGALNAELLHSRQLVAESSRSSERLRIARELHDSLGHHLTTLNLNLEICRHLPAPEKDPHIEKAQFLAKLLLADLRDVVSSWRAAEGVPLLEALTGLRHAVSGLDIEFDIEIESELPPVDAESSHMLLRCAQEAVTNALRHSGATRIVLSLRRRDDLLALAVHDNGRGTSVIAYGNGLSGIADRVLEKSGRCWVESEGFGKGFTVRVEIPLVSEPA